MRLMSRSRLISRDSLGKSSAKRYLTIELSSLVSTRIRRLHSGTCLTAFPHRTCLRCSVEWNPVASAHQCRRDVCAHNARVIISHGCVWACKRLLSTDA